MSERAGQETGRIDPGKGRHRPGGEIGRLAGVLLRVAALLAASAGPAQAQGPQLPVPCGGGACAGNGGPSVWVSAGNVQAPTVTGNTMNINQESDKAILNWSSFNIGPGAGVNFHQPSASSVALNKIFQGDPSKIMGALTANGQIYLINQNGFVFGDGATVNVHGLVASTLDMDNSLFKSSGIAQAINQQSPAFHANGKMGDINIAKGAVIKTDDNGQVMLFAPNITNDGEIDTPKGQTILAASQDKVYLKINSTDVPGLRGFLVEVNTGGTVTNGGKISVGEGDATLEGLTVNQDGLVSATASVQLNGSIRLLARDQVLNGSLSKYSDNSLKPPQITTHTGSVNFGPGSVTRVTPDASDASTTVDDQAQPVSTVDVMGKTIDLKGDSKIVVPGGQVNLTATANPQNVSNEANVPPNDSRLLMEAQSLIDVSGTTSTVLPMSRNTVQLQLRGNELADSPLQRNGVLYGKTVTVDARKGTPVANVSGAVQGIQRGISERLSPGGSVTAISEGDAILGKGAEVDFSGGKVTYQGGYLNTTKLYTKNGTVVDIGNADPNQTYTAVLGQYQENDPTWGVSKTYLLPGVDSGSSYTPGYVQGMDAGTFSVQAPGVVLDGLLKGGAAAGTVQRLAPQALAGGSPAWDRPYDQMPLGGQLIIGDLAQAHSGNVDTPSVVFENQVTPVSNFDTSFAGQPVDLSAALFSGGGITRAAIYSSGSITVPAGVTLAMAPGGTLTLGGGNGAVPADSTAPIPPSVEVDGTIRIPGGSVAVNTYKMAGTGNDVKSQSVVLGPGSQIDVAGMWVNDTNALNPGGATGPAVIDGGSVTVSALGDLTMGPGSLIDVSGGAQVLSDGTVQAGTGGDVSLASQNTGLVTTMTLDGTVRGDALYQGGTLSLTADGIRIQVPGAGQPGPAGELLLDPAMFQDDGFGSYSFKATHSGLSIADNTAVDLVEQNRVLNAGYQNRPTGADMAQFSRLQQLPLIDRQPVNLSLTSSRSPDIHDSYGVDAGLTVGTGAVIQADPKARVSLSSDRMITVAGTIDAPAGAIDLTLGNALSSDGFFADKAIWLAPGARLEAPAFVVPVPNDLGLAEGQALDAGTISLQAQQGLIVAAPGSTMDVSGTHQILSVLSDTGAGSSYVTTDVAGAAGGIQLTAADGMYLDGAMNAKAAPVAGAAGGSLSITLDSADRPTAKQSDSVSIGSGGFYAPLGPRSIQIGADASPVAPPGANPGDALFSAAQLAQLGATSANDVPSVAHLTAAQIQQGGFDSLFLTVRPVVFQQTVQPTSGAAIAFNGDVNLSVAQQIVLDTPVLSTQNGRVTLSAPYVAIGPTETAERLSGAPSAGGGSLNVKADFVDLIGDTALQGFGSAANPAALLQATQDIRLQGIRVVATRDITGSFQAAGDLQLQAGQVYPSTLTHFALSVVNDPQGTIVFSPSATAPPAPLSAGGVLTVSAPNIVQDGTLRAPFGDIHLEAGRSLQLQAGSLTSVSGSGLTVPFGETQLGQDWVMAYTNNLLSVIGQQCLGCSMALPSKQISLNAPSVSFAKGATVDVSGGGDLYAYEFQPGPGGSKDVLLPANDNGAFAVVPSLGSLYAPVDPLISSQGLRPGNTIYLNAGNGLPAGEYAMLPARYALLPGAFLVTPVAGSAGMTPGNVYPQFSGIPVVAGRQEVAGTDIRSSLWSGYAVENGAQVRQRAQYIESYANTFFATDANGQPTNLPLPRDAGAVTITAGQDLALGGRVNGRSTNGRGSQVDIVAPQLDVVTAPDSGANGVQILAGDLNNLGADSVLLGGQRQVTGDGVAVQAQSQSVTIKGGVSLTLPELMLVAASGTDANGNPVAGQVSVAAGATLKGSGSAVTDEGTLTLSGDSALLRIASGAQPTVQRTGVPTAPTARLTVAPGAQLIAGNADASGTLQGGSLILDSAGSTQSAGDIQVGNGGSLRLGASHISLGDVGSLSGSQALLLSNEALGKLDVSNLSLISRSSIDIYGPATVGANSLTLQAQSIDGYANDGLAASLHATTLNLIGDAQGQAATSGSGSGILNLRADKLIIGSNDGQSAGESQALSVSGFDQVNVSTGTVMLQGAGRLDIAGASSMTAGQFTGAAASNWTISSTGALTVLGAAQTSSTSDKPGLGAALTLQGSKISFDTAALLPAGRFSLAATGAASGDDVLIGPQASIDVSGRVVDFSGTSVASPGGEVSLTSAAGDAQIQSGATINVAGGTDSAGAGGISVDVPSGRLSNAGDLVATHAPGGDGHGSFSLDAGSIGDFGALTSSLSRSGFTGTVAIRIRNGNLQLGTGDTLTANDLTLTADSGNIDIYGTIDASGTQAGQVRINAGNDLTVHGTARIDAHATGKNAKGGDVLLGTARGALTFETGAVIDVTGTQTADVKVQQGGQTVTRTGTGLVQFRVPRTSLAASDLSGAADGIKGAGLSVIEADEVYTVTGGTLGSSAVAPRSSNPYYQDAVTFMQNEPALMAGLGLPEDANVQLRPGVVLQSAGALTLDAPLDLSQWRFGPQAAPGILTLRSSGNLDIAGSVSDGFTAGTNMFGQPVDLLRKDDSWALRLVAGADLASADPLAVTAGAGNLTVAGDVTVRTGSGYIDMTAGGNLVLGNNQSAVYTAGVDGGSGTYSPLYVQGRLDNGQFPLGGGDLSVVVDGNILAQADRQWINDWQPRLGGIITGATTSDLPTTWAISFANFHQGVGALGGGNVSVSAGGSISDLSVFMPTIGTQVGQAEYNGGQVTLQTNQVVVTGGTRLDVSAGGDISGGIYDLGQGLGTVRAGGAIGPSQQTSHDPILALGNGTFNVVAGGDLGLEDVVNPTMLPQSNLQLAGFSPAYSYFYTYGPDSGVQLTSLAGDVSFSDVSSRISNLMVTLDMPSVPATSFDQSLLSVYPGTLSATALQGNINLGNSSFTLYPAAQGQLTLLARGSVVVPKSGLAQINVSDADPNLLPSVAQPANDVGSSGAPTRLELSPHGTPIYNHASVPVHTGDAVPVLIVARDGSVGAAPGTVSFLNLFLPKPFRVIAGQDVRNTTVIGQNLTPNDVSLIQAGRDAVFTSDRDVNGVLQNSSKSNMYNIGGPGRLDVVAGRNVDLGTGVGIVSAGNIENPALPSTSAAVTVIAGVSQAPDYNAFVQKYLVDSDLYRAQLGQFLSQYSSGDLALSNIDRFKALPLDVQLQFILQVFFSELKASGVAAADSQNKDYSRGFDAINTLFPGSADKSSGTATGNLNMLLSRIATLAGGDITLVVPYGLVNAGTANTSAISKDPSQLGILVEGGGNIDAYMQGNFNVNQSRVFTLGGGDILVWSSLGDIDAGRGAKTAIAVPPPTLSFDPLTGAITLQATAAIAGSGIRASTPPGGTPGNVYLFAPKGVVNASDAGIASEGNLTIGASHVLGASNISVGGVAVGVPPVTPISVAAGLTGLSNASSSVSKAAANSVNSMTSSETANTPLADAALSYLKVVVISLGDMQVGN